MVHIIYHNVDINCGPDPEVVTSHSLTEPGESCKFSQVLRHKLIKSNRQSQTYHCTTDEIFMILNVSLSSNIWKIAILFCRLPHKTCSYIYKWWNWSPKCWSKLKICICFPHGELISIKSIFYINYSWCQAATITKSHASEHMKLDKFAFLSSTNKVAKKANGMLACIKNQWCQQD